MDVRLQKTAHALNEPLIATAFTVIQHPRLLKSLLYRLNQPVVALEGVDKVHTLQVAFRTRQEIAHPEVERQLVRQIRRPLRVFWLGFADNREIGLRLKIAWEILERDESGQAGSAK